MSTPNATVPPLLFLDFDDVICPGAPLCKYSSWDIWEVVKRADRTDRMAVMDGATTAEARQVLLDVINAVPQVRFVISSSWRKTFDRDQVEQILREFDLAPVAERVLQGDRWCTPLGPLGPLGKQGGAPRAVEVARWLHSYHQEGQAYAVLDDNYSGASLEDCLVHPLWAGRVIICDVNVGLRRHHAALIVQALQMSAPRRMTQQGMARHQAAKNVPS